MTDALLQFDDIAGGYGETEVVRGISGRISEGEVVAITGRNGVGKSTLLKLLFGSLTLTRGRVSFQRSDLVGVAPAHRSQLGISFCPQERIVFCTQEFTERGMGSQIHGCQIEPLHHLAVQEMQSEFKVGSFRKSFHKNGFHKLNLSQCITHAFRTSALSHHETIDNFLRL